MSFEIPSEPEDKKEGASSHEPISPEASEKPASENHGEHHVRQPRIADPRMINYIETHGKEAGFEGTRDRLLVVLETVKDDEKALKLIDETLRSIFQYVEKIYRLEVGAQIHRLRLEGEDYRHAIQNLDEARKRAHDALISNLTACNRYLFQNYEGEIPEGGLCNIDPQTLQAGGRRAIGDWAVELEYEIISNRRA